MGKEFVFNGVDFEKSEDEKLLYDYIKLYSYYISDFMYVYNTTKKAMYEKFCKIKDKVIVLAKKGSMKALSFYLHNEVRENWKEELVAMAQSIEKDVPLKTPEEWEVVAGLHYYDKVYVMINGIETVKDLNYALDHAWNRFDELENEYHHGRYTDFFTLQEYDKEDFEQVVKADFRRVGWLLDRMREEKYCDAIRHAQVGYYGRYLKSGKALDMWQFLELKKSPYNLYIPYKNIEKLCSMNYTLTNGHFYAILKHENRKKLLSKMFSKLLKKGEVKEPLIDAFAFARCFNLLGRDGYLGTSKFDKLIDGDFMKLSTQKEGIMKNEEAIAVK